MGVRGHGGSGTLGREKEGWEPRRAFPERQSFQLSANGEFPGRAVPSNVEDIRLAANLAIFHVLLRPAGGRLHRSFIPLSASGALKSRCQGSPPGLR